MPTYLLKVRMDLENIEKVVPIENNLWKFDIESTDGQLQREGITLYKLDNFEIEGGRGEANFVMRWDKKSPHQAWMKIIDHREVKSEYSRGDNGNWVAILAIESRGLEVKNFCPGIDFVIESTGEKQFKDVDMGEKDWADYDDDNDLAVSIMNFEHKLERV